ncbi:MAG: rubrerythrin family protein, partial [Proteobacteria bacterium]|nr:rubrerythrin family protein [Pseudomonadota bacterium]
MSVSGTQTEQNLAIAYLGECQAMVRYTQFAQRARSERFHRIASAFEEIARQELAHAQALHNQLEKGSVELHFHLPVRQVEGTPTNLKTAIIGETYEHSTMYPDFGRKAREEGLEEVASLFDALAKTERQHDQR